MRLSRLASIANRLRTCNEFRRIFNFYESLIRFLRRVKGINLFFELPQLTGPSNDFTYMRDEIAFRFSKILLKTIATSGIGGRVKYKSDSHNADRLAPHFLRRHKKIMWLRRVAA